MDINLALLVSTTLLGLSFIASKLPASDLLIGYVLILIDRPLNVARVFTPSASTSDPNSWSPGPVSAEPFPSSSPPSPSSPN